MPKKKGLPKALSLNSKARSTSKATNQRDWSEMTHERSFTQVMGGMEKFVPRKIADVIFRDGKPIPKKEYKGLRGSVERIGKKIQALKPLTLSLDPKIAGEARAKLLKLEELHNRQIGLLQVANSVKQAQDQRIENRRRVREMQENGEITRLEKGKLVPTKKSIWSAQEQAKIERERSKLLDSLEKDFGE